MLATQPPSASPERLLTTAELADALGVSTQTVRNAQAKGQIQPAISIGKKCKRYSLATVMAALAPTAA